MKQSPTFDVPAVFQPFFESPKRRNILYGGRGSGKSHTVARFCILRAMQKPTKILCTRELQKSIAESVYALLCSVIAEMRLDEFFVIQRDRILGRNGSEFIFAGVRSNTNEIKSMEGIGVCWVEEAQAMTQQSIDVLVPTIRAENSIIVFTFNPFKDSDPVYVMSQHPDDSTLVIKANYGDNPYFPDVLRQEMETMKRTDYDKYLWVWEGKCLGISAAQIFRGKYSVEDFVTPPNAALHYGCDWGFSTDPTTVVRSFIVGNTLYIDQEAWGVGVDTVDLPALFDTVQGTSVYPIYADNARPETISAMQHYGYNVIAADKWKGSVEDGLSYLRSFDKIIINPRCKHTIEEFDLYQYKVDAQTDEVLRIPVDRYNHCIDALRYSHTVTMRASSSGKVYSDFTLKSLVTPYEIGRDVYIGTFTFPGKTYVVALGANAGQLCIVDAFEQTAIDFEKIKEKFAATSRLTWFPFARLEDVPAPLVQKCIDADVEPAVGQILPADNEGTTLLNRLFKTGALVCFNTAVDAQTSLNERVFMAGGFSEKSAQLSRIAYFCMLIEYLVWRVIGRLDSE